MTDETTEVATTLASGGNLVTDDMADLMKGAGHTSDFKKEDLGTPFVQIVQSGSAYAKRSDPKYIDGAVEGMIIDTLTLQLRTKAAFVPCKFQVEYTEWKPDQGPLVRRWGTDRSAYDEARHYVYEGKFVDWGPRYVMKESFSENGPGTPFNDKTDPLSIITPAGVYYGLLLDEDGTSLESCISLTGSQAKKTRRFNDLINALELVDSKGNPYEPPMYARVYAMTTVPERDTENSWMGWKIDPGPLTLTCPGGKHLFQKAMQVRARADAGKIKVMETEAANDAQRSDDASRSAPQRAAASTVTAQQLDQEIPF